MRKISQHGKAYECFRCSIVLQWIIDKIGGRLRKKEEIEEQRCANLDVIKYASGVLLFLTVSKIEHLSSIC